MGLFVFAAPAGAQDFSLLTTLDHPNQRPNNQDRFGSGLAISGSTLFVGARDELGANDYSGVVHVFSDVDWSEVAQLKSSVDADFEFGSAIQLDGERALISNTAIDGGVVWFFEKVAGVWAEKLRVKGLVNEAFGYRLALRGDFAFIAASRVGTGNVRVYRRVAGTWSEVQVLTASDAQADDFFGYSIAFDGQRLAVGAPGNLLGPKRCGVYTFSKVGDAFVQDGEIAGDDPASYWFGAGVGVSGDTLIVNAPPVYQATNGGKALVYERRAEQWQVETELTVDGEASFPEGLALDHDTAYLGARTNDARNQNVYAFKRTNGGWQAAQQLNFTALGENPLASWAFQDGTFLIGSRNALRTESVQVYRAPGHESSSGGAQAAGGSEATGGTSTGGASGQNSAAAGDHSRSSTSGGGPPGPTNAEPSNPGGAASNETAAAGQSANSESAERGGCTFTPSSNAHTWPIATLALAMALTRKRRSAPNALARPTRCRTRRRAQSRMGR